MNEKDPVLYHIVYEDGDEQDATLTELVNKHNLELPHATSNAVFQIIDLDDNLHGKQPTTLDELRSALVVRSRPAFPKPKSTRKSHRSSDQAKHHEAASDKTDESTLVCMICFHENTCKTDMLAHIGSHNVTPNESMIGKKAIAETIPVPGGRTPSAIKDTIKVSTKTDKIIGSRRKKKTNRNTVYNQRQNRRQVKESFKNVRSNNSSSHTNETNGNTEFTFRPDKDPNGSATVEIDLGENKEDSEWNDDSELVTVISILDVDQDLQQCQVFCNATRMYGGPIDPNAPPVKNDTRCATPRTR